jgi:hypothetical protein
VAVVEGGRPVADAQQTVSGQTVRQPEPVLAAEDWLAQAGVDSELEFV